MIDERFGLLVQKT